MKLWLLAFLGCAAAFNADFYEGYQVFEVVPTHDYQLAALRQMTEISELDFWLEPVALGRAVHVMVAPAEQDAVVGRFRSMGLTTSIHVQNVAENLRKNWAEISQRKQESGQMVYDYSTFNVYADFMTELDALRDSCPTGFTCSVSTIGQSYEGRNLNVLHISSGNKPTIWIDSLIHSREWLAGATTMMVFNEMIRNYGTNAEAAALMDNFNWYFLPVMNPDGYEFTWSDERYWRKNRAPNSGSACVGTDLNRNYDYNWGEPGASDSPCSDTYHGPSVASEPETQAVQTFGASVASELWGWLTFHTYGYYMLYPFGDCSSPIDSADLDRNVGAMCNAIEGTHNTNWDCGNSCEVLYDTSGTTSDWCRGGIGVKYPYTPELRGNDFVISDTQIQPSFEEVWNGIVAYTNDMLANPPNTA